MTSGQYTIGDTAQIDFYRLCANADEVTDLKSERAGIKHYPQVVLSRERCLDSKALAVT